MIVSARKAKHLAFLAIPLAIAAFAFGYTDAIAASGGVQACEPSSTCEIGEYLFDDDYTPITAGASCTFTATNPSGTVVYNGVSMTGESDGWYGYEFTAPSTEGFYRAEVTCVYNGETLSIDKSFQVDSGVSVSVPSSDDIASAVWSHSDRTLSSFSTLVRDIWLHSERTLTSLSTETSTSNSTTTNIYDGTNYSNVYTGTEGGDEITTLLNTAKENRLLLEELVNGPIIENYWEDEEDMDLSSKVDETKATANQMYGDAQYIRSKATNLTVNWNKIGEVELRDAISDLQRVLGSTSDKRDADSMYGRIAKLDYYWGWEELEDIQTEASGVEKILNSTQLDLASRGKSAQAYNDLKSIALHLDNIEVLIGDTSNTSSDLTLFGELKAIAKLAGLFTDQQGDIAGILRDWESLGEGERKSRISTVASLVSPINKIRGLSGILLNDTEKIEDGRELKNQALAVGGVIDTNVKLLAAPAGKSMSNTWIELGSMKFVTVITNPSSLISQTAELNYGMPPEIREEHILDADGDIEVSYNIDRKQMYVHGEFTLEPNEVVTASVRVEDIWNFSDDQLTGISERASQLYGVIENSSYAGQGVILLNDIEMSLDRVRDIMAGAVTPADQIRAYREAVAEMQRIADNIDKLQGFVNDASGQSALFGFIGGAGTMALWGLILIILIGFGVMTYYIKQLRGGDTDKPKKKKKDSHHGGSTTGHRYPQPFSADYGRLFRGAFGVALFGIFVSVGTGIAVSKWVSRGESVEPAVLSESVEEETDPSAALGMTSESEQATSSTQSGTGGQATSSTQSGTGGQVVVKIVTPEEGLFVYAQPSTASSKVGLIADAVAVSKLREIGDWTEVVYSKETETKQGWVESEYVEQEQDPGSDLPAQVGSGMTYASGEVSKQIQIDETPTGWLRVRTSPSGEEITKVLPGEIYELVGQEEDWYVIEIEGTEGTEGYVSSRYASVVE